MYWKPHNNQRAALSLAINPDNTQSRAFFINTARETHISVLTLFQALMCASVDKFIHHEVAAAQILKSRGYSGPRDKFEQILLLTLRASVVRSPSTRSILLIALTFVLSFFPRSLTPGYSSPPRSGKIS